MSSNVHAATAGRNAAVDAMAALLNNGYLRIYSGTQPANGNASLGAAVLLAELRFGATAFGGASSGLATANAITSTTDAAASGTAAFFRAFKSDGTTPVTDGSVGTSSADVILDTLAIVQHGLVAVSSMTLSLPA